MGLADAVDELKSRMKKVEKLGFQSIWEEIRAESVKFMRNERFHWALSPDLAHYVHDTPRMYVGYGEFIDHDISPSDIKSEPIEMDEVWWCIFTCYRNSIEL